MPTAFNFFSSLTPRIIKDIVPMRIKVWMAKKFRDASIRFYVDIVSSCNLRCPSCQRGQLSSSSNGVMDIELFTRIIQKIEQEYPGAVVCLFNWTEPFLHPQLAEFVRIVRHAGLDYNISTNLNILRSLDEILLAKPSNLKISLSGFTQEVYGIGHRGGDIDKVKDNMRRLSGTLKRLNSNLKVCVHYHKYNYNLHELDLMKEYASSLGFEFMSSWAFHMPVESALDYIHGVSPPEQRKFIETRYALTLNKALAATKPYRRNPCNLLDYIAIDFKGNVLLCCAVSEKPVIGPFLDLSPKGIKKKRAQHRLCSQCTKNGLHIYYTYHGYQQLCFVYDQIVKETFDIIK